MWNQHRIYGSKPYYAENLPIMYIISSLSVHPLEPFIIIFSPRRVDITAKVEFLFFGFTYLITTVQGSLDFSGTPAEQWLWGGAARHVGRRYWREWSAGLRPFCSFLLVTFLLGPIIYKADLLRPIFGPEAWCSILWCLIPLRANLIHMILINSFGHSKRVGGLVEMSRLEQQEEHWSKEVFTSRSFGLIVV